MLMVSEAWGRCASTGIMLPFYMAMGGLTSASTFYHSLPATSPYKEVLFAAFLGRTPACALPPGLQMDTEQIHRLAPTRRIGTPPRAFFLPEGAGTPWEEVRYQHRLWLSLALKLHPDDAARRLVVAMASDGSLGHEWLRHLAHRNTSANAARDAHAIYYARKSRAQRLENREAALAHYDVLVSQRANASL